MAGEDLNLPEQCCTLPPFVSNYQPVGQRFSIEVPSQEQLPVYETGDAKAQIVLVGVHDIFGLSTNTLQGADYLAALRGYRILLPDFFRGKGWDIKNVPPKEGRPAMQAYIQSIGSWEKVEPSLIALLNYIRDSQTPETQIAAYGFCFGAKKLVQGAHLNHFRCMGFIHPTNFQVDDADNIQCPIALLPSQGEDQGAMDAFYARIQEKGGEIAKHSVRQDSLDVHHGFASSRSDWSDPHLAQRAREAYSILDAFFRQNLRPRLAA